MGSRTYDRRGEPMAFADWTRAFENTAERLVEQTQIGDVSVSTVWLGLDHRYGGVGPPLIFETMVFGGPLDGEQERYSTEKEARAGHASMVERVKGAA